MTDNQGEPLFVASDIAKILEYRDAYNMTRRLDPDDKGTRSASTLGGILILTERIDPTGKIRPQLLATPAGQTYLANILTA